MSVVENGGVSCCKRGKVGEDVNGKNKQQGNKNGLSERAAFLESFQKLREAIVSDHLVDEAMDCGDAKKWVHEMLTYNVPGGKLNRGISVVDTLKILLNNSEKTHSQAEIENLIFQARVVGWCIEWVWNASSTISFKDI